MERQRRLDIASLWVVYPIAGPPVGGVVWYMMGQFILPVPSPMGFYDAPSWAEALEHHIGRLFLTMSFSYIILPMPLACALVITLFRLTRLRPECDLIVSLAVGLAAGIMLTYDDRYLHGYWRLYDIVDIIVACVAASLCCGWMTRRKQGLEGWPAG